MKWKTPYVDLLPGLSKAEFDALKADIKENGVRHKVEVDEDGNVLDGHNRLAIEPNAQTVVVRGLSEPEKHAYVMRTNSARRNLSPEQMAAVRAKQREVANKLRESDPKKWTQKRVAATVGVTRQAVAKWWDTSNATSCITSKPDGRLSLTKEQKARIVEQAASGETQSSLADEFKICQQRVSQILNNAARKADAAQRNEEITKREVADTFDELYDVIVIDPPWPMEKIEREVRPNQVGFDYPTMDEYDLEKFKLPMAADCHAWVWTTHKFLPAAMRLLGEWGLSYVCTFVWHKPGGFQPIGLPQYNCEFALYGRRGSPKFTTTKAFKLCFEAPRRKHSEKPEEFYELVRRVTDGKRIDIFNRRKIDGFVGWGNEA